MTASFDSRAKAQSEISTIVSKQNENIDTKPPTPFKISDEKPVKKLCRRKKSTNQENTEI